MQYLYDMTGRRRRTLGWALRALVLTLVAAVSVATVGATRPAVARTELAVDPAAPLEPTEGPARFDRSFVHGRVAVDGAVLHYVRGGSGPALVLLHGWPQTWWAFHKVMPELARHHTVVALDLPGLGDSTVPANGFDKDTIARRLHQAVSRLGLHDVDILAHDTGALAAYPYARLFPSDVDRVVVIDAPLSGFGLENFYGVSYHFLLNMLPEGTPEKLVDDEDVGAYLGPLFDGEHVAGAVDRQVYFRAYRPANHRHAGYEYYRAFPTDIANNQANASHKVTAPILAIGGEFTFGLFVGQSFSQVATNVHSVVAPGSAHFVPEEVPQFLLSCVGLFFGDTPPGGPVAPELAGCVP
jgi:pimeloyl-ACP methyl ester carboxylesterase